MRLLAVVTAASIAACAGGPPVVTLPAATSRARAPAKDWAADLVARLPRGADRCEVARALLLGDEERALYGPTGTVSLAWRGELSVVAVARAAREAREKSLPAEVAFLRVALPDEDVRKRLAEASGLALLWDADEAECGPRACPTAVRFVAPGVLRLARGAWPAEPVGAGIAPRCRALVEQHADAIEAWARRERGPASSGDATAPLRSTTVVLRRAEGVRLRREDLLPSTIAAESAALSQRAGAVPGKAFGVPGLVGEVRQQDALVTLVLDVRWEDLRFARDDRARLAEAERAGAILERLEPEAAIDVNALAAVVAQIEARLDLLSFAHVPDRTLAAETRALLDRARLAHPGEASLVALQERLEAYESSRVTR